MKGGTISLLMKSWNFKKGHVLFSFFTIILVKLHGSKASRALIARHEIRSGNFRTHIFGKSSFPTQQFGRDFPYFVWYAVKISDERKDKMFWVFFVGSRELTELKQAEFKISVNEPLTFKLVFWSKSNVLQTQGLCQKETVIFPKYYLSNHFEW